MNKDFWDNYYWNKHYNETDNKDYWVNDYLLFLPKKGRVLDLGCGLGEYSNYFYNNGYNVVALDISKKVESKINPNIKFILFDMINNFPFPDNYFDIVFCNLSLHYFNKKDTSKIIDEIYRILNSNGILIGTVPTIEELKEISGIEIEKNFILRENGTKLRVFDNNSFNLFFSKYKKLFLEIKCLRRWNKIKKLYIFIYMKGKT